MARTNGHGNGRVRLIVADGSPIDRAGLVALLEREADIEVLGATSSVDETISMCDQAKPDVLLLTLTLPGGSEDGALPAILGRQPGLRVVAFSEHSREQCLVLNPPALGPSGRGSVGTPVGRGSHACTYGTSCLRAAAESGARGTVRRNAEFETLLEAIRRVHAGEFFHEEEAREENMSPADAYQPLSERERMVAAQIARGLSNKEIATALDISEATVKKHVGRVLAKLALQDRLQVGLFLARNPQHLRARGGNGHRVSAGTDD